VSLALVLVPGPVYEIEPEPYLRISFNVGPSYSFDASGPGTHATFAMRHHALMVIPPGTVVAHSTATPRPTGRALKPARLATFRISTDLLADSAIALDLPPERAQLRHQVVPGDEVLRLLSQALYADLREGHPDGPRATEHLAMALVTRLLLREQGRAAGPAKGGLDKARAHIDAHLGDALSLEDLAAVAGISLFHFCRVFRESIGVTPHQYIVAQSHGAGLPAAVVCPPAAPQRARPAGHRAGLRFQFPKPLRCPVQASHRADAAPVATQSGPGCRYARGALSYLRDSLTGFA
jgi:hypothetical protein